MSQFLIVLTLKVMIYCGKSKDIHTNLHSGINVRIKKIIQSHFTRDFIREMRLDDFLCICYVVMRVCIYGYTLIYFLMHYALRKTLHYQL